MTPGAIRIIAEAGVNHNGSLDRALAMVDAAAQAGADIIKFQAFVPDALASAEAKLAEYQANRNLTWDNQLDMLRQLSLTREQFATIMDRCRQCGIGFLATPFDRESLALLVELGSGLWKIASGEIVNLLLLRAIGSLRQEVILSTGMATLDEVADALDVLNRAGTANEKITLLHCTTQYPTPVEEVNLRAMDTMSRAWPDLAGVGYSDHTEGIDIALAAAGRGATTIEKHFTLDRSLPGPDHNASIEPEQLRELVASLRRIGRALGDGLKQPAPCEQDSLRTVRKSLVAARDIAPGEPFTQENLTTKRPGTGISPMQWDQWIGQSARRAFRKDEVIE